MEFKIDEQTLNDLELFNQALDGKSIFSCFNTACSDGGKACVRKMLERPLTDVNKIRDRVEAIRYLGFGRNAADERTYVLSRFTCNRRMCLNAMCII